MESYTVYVCRLGLFRFYADVWRGHSVKVGECRAFTARTARRRGRTLAARDVNRTGITGFVYSRRRNPGEAFGRGFGRHLVVSPTGAR
jgi:hypothetical protein